MKLALVERFRSVQGEGWNAGRDALFIRFAGCNLDCVFADGAVCDTPWEKPREKTDLAAVLGWVEAEAEAESMVVVTGGEPTMAPAFDALVTGIRDLGVYVAVETNGTLWRDGLAVADHVTVSPKDGPGIRHGFKLPNRAADPTPHPKVLALPPHEYRFVITGPDDPAPPYHPAQRGHYLSPAFEDDGTGLYYMEHGPRVVPGAAARCMEIVNADPRWRISLQTHKFLNVR